MRILLALVISTYSHTSMAATALSNSPGIVTTSDVIKIMASLGFVVMTVLVLAWGIRKIKGISYAQGGALKVISGLSLGAKEKLIIVEVSGKQMLLGVSSSGINHLCDLESPVKLHTKHQSEDSFMNTLKMFMRVNS